MLLVDAAGMLRVMASSSERADALDVMQAQYSEGPSFDCFVTGRVVARLSERVLPLGQGVADLAAVAIVQSRSISESRLLAEQLQVGLSSRVVIEQAKGVLAEQGQISVDAAFSRLRKFARATNRKLSEVALRRRGSSGSRRPHRGSLEFLIAPPQEVCGDVVFRGSVRYSARRTPLQTLVACLIDRCDLRSARGTRTAVSFILFARGGGT